MHLAFMRRWEEPLLIVGGQGRSGRQGAPGGAGHSSLGRGESSESVARDREEGVTEQEQEGVESGREGEKWEGEKAMGEIGTGI